MSEKAISGSPAVSNRQAEASQTAVSCVKYERLGPRERSREDSRTADGDGRALGPNAAKSPRIPVFALLFSLCQSLMSDITPQQFAQRISDFGLAERREVDQAMSELGVGDHNLNDMIKVMQGRGLVTTLQTDKILKGDRNGYFYGPYKVLYLIGAGTFARVYRAEKEGQVFAVKVLRKRFRDEVKELEQFLREGRMGLRLRHPNIVSIVDVIPDTRNPFLVMEFVEGQTLRELVKVRGKLPADLVVTIDV